MPSTYTGVTPGAQWNIPDQGQLFYHGAPGNEFLGYRPSSGGVQFTSLGDIARQYGTGATGNYADVAKNYLKNTYGLDVGSLATLPSYEGLQEYARGTGGWNAGSLDISSLPSLVGQQGRSENIIQGVRPDNSNSPTLTSNLSGLISGGVPLPPGGNPLVAQTAAMSGNIAGAGTGAPGLGRPTVVGSQNPLAGQTSALSGITPLASTSTGNLGGQNQALQTYNTGNPQYDAQLAQIAKMNPATAQQAYNAIMSGGTSRTTSTGTTGGISSGISTADTIFQQYLGQLTPSTDETNFTAQLNALTSQQAGINASRDLGIQGVNEQPIATPFLTGQGAAITNRAAVQTGALSAQAVPLQTRLAQLQAKRQSAVDISKAQLEYQTAKEKLASELANRNADTSITEINGRKVLVNNRTGAKTDLGPATISEVTPTAQLAADNKLRDDFRTELLKWDKIGTREQFIARLRTAFAGQINKDDITRAVYEAYPDGYNT